MINTVRSVLLDRTSVLEVLPAVARPAPVISGARDAILPKKLSLDMVGKLADARHV